MRGLRARGVRLLEWVVSAAGTIYVGAERIVREMGPRWRVSWRRVLVPTVAGTVLLAAGIAWALWTPYRGFEQEAHVEIAAGTSVKAMASRLEEAGVIRSRWHFLLLRCFQPKAVLQAGEYLFTGPASLWEVYRRIARGDVYYRKLVVREGDNIFDIAASLDRIGLIGGKEFLRVARDPSLIRDLAPEAPTLEGYLFPAVYEVGRRTTAEELCKRMTDRFRAVWRELGTDRPVHQVVTLASLIEKETAIEDERPLVASVYVNRLKRGMALDCDPTAIYAALLEGRYTGTLTAEDLARPSPYNTYQCPGLPPGPIANPGLASLKAALNPASTNYLYFVARGDGSGRHTFSSELQAHSRAVARYRRANNAKNHQARIARAVPGGASSRPDR